MRQNQSKVQTQQTKKVEEEPIRPLITPFQKTWGSESTIRELAIIVLREQFGDIVAVLS